MRAVRIRQWNGEDGLRTQPVSPDYPAAVLAAGKSMGIARFMWIRLIAATGGRTPALMRIQVLDAQPNSSVV